MSLTNQSAAFLAKNRSRIIAEWETRVRDCLPAARSLPTLALQARLPELLDQLLEALPRPSIKGEAYTVEPTPGKQPSQQSIFTGHTLEEVLKEYELFHDVILETLESAAGVAVKELRIIQSFIHKAIQAAAAAFIYSSRTEVVSQEKDFLSAVLENLSDGIVACDAQGILTLFNRASRDFHGLPELPIPPEEWAAYYDLYKSDGCTPLETSEIPLLRALRGEVVCDHEMVIAPKGGPKHFLLASGRSLRNSDGKITGAVVAMKDMTAAKAVERANLALEIEKTKKIALEESERVSVQILGRISEAFFALDRDWTITYVNQRLEAITGMSRAELIGKTIWECFPSTVNSVFETEYRRAVENQTPVSFEAYFPPLETWFSVKAHPSAEGLSVFCEDVSELRRARYEVKMSEEWLSATLMSIGDAVIATEANTDGTIVLMNKVAEKLTGWSLKEARGRPILEIFKIINQKTREQAANPIDRVISEGVVVGLANHTALKSRNGHEYIIEDSAAPVRGMDRTMIGVVLVFRDISEKYAQETKLAETYERLQQSEARTRSVLENALDAVVGMDDRGLITHWNLQAERVFGFTQSEAIGMRMSETIIPDQYRLAHENGMKRYLLSGEGPVLNKRIEITAKRRDGIEFPIELSVTPIKMGEQKMFAGFIRDISEHQKLKRELLLKSNALENSLNGFDIVNEHGKFVYANQAYLALWGYESLDEIFASSPVDHCADPTMPQKIIGILKDKGECDIEFVAKRKDGSTFDVRMWARLAHDSDGREVYPTTSIDITERKHVERELRASKEAAERANRAKSQFLANMSHEIRTPLAAILGFSEFLLEPDQTPSDRYECVSTIRRNAEQLFHLINELLDLSKIEADRLEVELVRFNLDDVIQDVHKLLIVQALHKGIELNIMASGPLQKSITTDPTRLRQILVNLVGNAIKFTERGKVDVLVAMVQPLEQNKPIQLILTVHDTGIGLSEEQSLKIWEPFVQADSSTTRKFGGTGLGLSLSKRLARALGGDLVLISSAPGKGSTFRITIDAGPAETFSFVSDHSTPIHGSKGIVGKQPTRRFEGARILVVEDSSDNQKLIKRFLEREGASVTIANDGSEGIAKARSALFDLVLMDVQMPVMDGYTATSKLLAEGYAVPIIALTAHAMRGERERAMAHGFFDHLTKPLDSVAMIEKIAAALRQTKVLK